MLASRRTLQSQLNLRGIEFEFIQGTAERVAVHAELSRSFALVALVVAQHFLDKAAAKFPDSLLVSNATGVHLHDKIIQFAFHFNDLS